jgi:hypothetical protein
VAGRSAGSIARWLDANLYRLDGPAQYLGDEPGTLRSGWPSSDVLWEIRSGVRMCMAASWDYSQAAGNMAIPAVYASVNDAGPGYLCDRWYLPATQRDMSLLEKASIPAFGIETRRPLREFDIVATSISYTVLLMNFCKTLSMSGIPLRWKDREEQAGDYPMIMIGGQAYCAPEFMSPVADCVWLGEVEDAEGTPGGIGEVLAVIESMKAAGLWASDRLGCYARLARQFTHLYFPRFTAFTYRYEDRGLPEPVKMVAGYEPLLEGMPFPHRARQVKDLDKTRPLTSMPLLYSDPGMGAGGIEVAKGCIAWCGFCRLSWVTKPYRQHSVGYLLAQAKLVRLAMGCTDISLVAPDPPVHTQLKALIAGLMEQVTSEIDASSMRVDDFISDPDLSLLLSMAGAESVTMGAEGGSQRIRDLAGKGTSDDDLAKAVTAAIRVGIKRIKIYFISNWPGELPGDVMRVVELARRLADIRQSFGTAGKGVRIIFSWTPLLIEAQTPLQWFPATAPDYTLQSAMDMLRDLHVDMHIGTKANPAKMAFFQACQRASREAGEAIVDVIEELGTASWGGFSADMKERLDVALMSHGFRNGLADLFGERFEHDLFGWEHISTGVAKSLMWRVYQGMVRFLENTDPETYDDHCGGDYHGQEFVQRCDQGCQGNSCGACSREDLELRRDYIEAGKSERDLQADPPVPVDHATVACRLRLKVRRPAAYRFVSNEFYRHLVRRAAFRACEKTGFPAIAVRTVRLASDSFGYRDRSEGTDYVEFALTRRIDTYQAGEFLIKAGVEMMPWLEWAGTFEVLPAAGKMPSKPMSLWELAVDAPEEKLTARLGWWGDQDEVPVILRSESFYAGESAEHGNAKEHVADMWLARDGHRLLLRMKLTGRLGPYQAAAALLGKASWIELARYPARRLEFFGGDGRACLSCGRGIPSSLLDVPFDEDHCPRCRDEAAQLLISGLERSGV